MRPLPLLPLIALAPPPRCVAAPPEAGDVHDVVIVGAGIAGIAAAEALARANVTDFIILESRNYTGGRVHAIPFGDPAVHRGVVEKCANWVQGAAEGSRSPAWRLARRAGMAMWRIPGSTTNFSTYGLHDATGAAVPDAARRAARAGRMVDCINRTAQRDGPDRSEAAAMAACGWRIRDGVDAAMEWEATSANDCLRPDELSLQFALPDPSYADLGPDDYFVHDQRERGFAQIVDEVAADAGLAPGDARVRLGAEVTSVRAGGCGARGAVTVATADGRSFAARRAVVTLPLGVMQRRHAELFRAPPLPAAQVDGLGAFAMGNFTKMWAQWRRPFWEDRGHQWLAALADGDPPGWPQEFHDLGALVPGFNTLFTFVVGEASVAWEAMSDDDAARALVARLRPLFPGVDIPPPAAFLITRHGSEPEQYGAYSTVPLGATEAQFRAMAVPLAARCAGGGDPRVFFGGEHTCAAFAGYVHGGYESGRQAAAQALRSLGHAPAVESLCDSYGVAPRSLRMRR